MTFNSVSFTFFDRFFPYLIIVGSDGRTAGCETRAGKHGSFYNIDYQFHYDSYFFLFCVCLYPRYVDLVRLG